MILNDPKCTYSHRHKVFEKHLCFVRVSLPYLSRFESKSACPHSALECEGTTVGSEFLAEGRVQPKSIAIPSSALRQ